MPKQKTENWKVYEPLIQNFEQEDISEKISAAKPEDIEVNITKRAFIINVENDAAKRLLEIARKKKISSTKLLQHWLKEKISEFSLNS